VSGFDERNGPAQELERRIITRLRQQGWVAFPFGQALLPEECRIRLSTAEDEYFRPSLFRWLPDIITFASMTANQGMLSVRTLITGVDVKACGNRTNNFSIEISAVEAAEAFIAMYTPTVFVFDDGSVLTPRVIRQRGTRRNDGNGSRTAYYLVEKRFARSFDEAFPPLNSQRIDRSKVITRS
jgi:hypothetical protein